MTPVPPSNSPRPIRSKREYDAAVAEIDRLIGEDPAPGSELADRLELLALVIEAFDDRHHALPARANPQSVVLFALEQQGKTRADLVPILGSKSRVSEFLGGKRRLSLPQISALRRELRIPADLLIETDARDTDAGAPPDIRAPRAGPVGRVSESTPPYAADRTGVDALVPALQQVVERLDGLASLLESHARQMDALVSARRGAARESAASAWRLGR